ncbi:MAG: 3-oxoacyl-(acyl-carrier-protein) reductase [Deltaproteobacteria bacterium]|jgi:3-oxoacyl-[acyl-carrier protein] reductase|nr:3-oxoacyl-(acyl-carrier-protein) reductase [Deltaproteobacteria bacterium]
MNTSLEGQVALVTGASRGIGRMVACTLAKAGAHVLANFVHNALAAEETVRMAADAGGRVTAIQFDIADPEAVRAAIATLIEQHGHCDILVNNAGMTIDNLVVRLKPTDWDQVMAVNLRGTFNCTKAVLRSMMRAHYGRIINMGSIIGSMGNAGQAAYATAKAGIVGFTKSMARELAERNITVNAVAPGFIDTEMTANLPEAVRSEYLRMIPAGRLGTAAEVADAVLFLARRESGYITGQVLGVNGGLYM